MVYVCDHCGTSFTTEGNLAVHLKSAKYCLDKRGVIAEHECQSCGKSFSRRSNLDRHQELCNSHENFPKKFRELLDMKDARINELEFGLDEKDVEIQSLLDDVETDRERIERLKEEVIELK